MEQWQNVKDVKCIFALYLNDIIPKMSLLTSSLICKGSNEQLLWLLTCWPELGWAADRAGVPCPIPSHPLSGTSIIKLKLYPYVSCSSTNYIKHKLHSATITMLRCIVLIAVSSASQFAGIIHWISLVILSVFFSEVCIIKVFHYIQNCKVFLCCHWNEQEFNSNLTVNKCSKVYFKKKKKKTTNRCRSYSAN